MEGREEPPLEEPLPGDELEGPLSEDDLDEPLPEDELDELLPEDEYEAPPWEEPLVEVREELLEELLRLDADVALALSSKSVRFL